MRRGVTVLLLAAVVIRATPAAPAAPDLRWFFQAASRDDRTATAALAELAASWKNQYTSMVVDLARLMRPARRPSPDGEFPERAAAIDPDDASLFPADPSRAGPAPILPGSPVRSRLTKFLENRTGKRFGDDLNRWREWMWSLPYDPHPEYATFKGRVYAQIDPRFEDFFRSPLRTSIRLDEVDWGGVTVNGIPPLEYPSHISAAEAGYLKGDHVVFGVYFDGVPRAYPKRILAWHELVRDRVANVELTLVYCTLCGTVIPYDSRVGGVTRTFGTSGLLYRSNKLMFDAGTRSLWSSLDGAPVVGPLVGSGLRLTMLPVVTTTWGEWRRAHPGTSVLSLDTGFKRDYSEGAAYRDYFATDALMFRVPRTDPRLKNKAEVLVFRLAEKSGRAQPVAIAIDLLSKRRVYQLEIADQRLVIVTTRAGANRVYQAGSHHFSAGPGEGSVVDEKGAIWLSEENHLRSATDPGGRLPRVPASRAFWFGWFAQYPDTMLVK